MTTTEDLNKIPCHKPKSSWRLIENKALIINLISKNEETPQMYLLNDVGSKIWQLLNGTNTIENIVQQLAYEFEIDIPQLTSDTLDFIQTLLDKQLVEFK